MPTHSMTPLMEGGALTALAVILALLSAVVPGLGFFFLLAWPVPIAVLACRHGLRWAMLSLVASGILLSMVLSPVGAGGIVLSSGSVGLALGWAYRRGWSAARVFGFSLIVGTAGQAACVGFVLLLTGLSPFDFTLEQMKLMAEEILRSQEQMGMREADLAGLRTQLDDSLELLSQMAAVLFCVTAGVLVSVAHFLTGNTLRRLGTDAPKFPPFAEWRLPQAFAYLFGFAMVGIYWGATREIVLLFQIAVAGEMVGLLAGLIEGFALLTCVMQHFRITGIWRWLFYLVILLNGLFLQILALTGLFDMVFDYRKRFGRNQYKD